MKKALVSMSIATLLTAAGIPAQAQENLIYVAVEPCRLAETRPALGGAGPIPAFGTRNFLVYGTGAELSSQGGAAGGCAHPRALSGVEPLAISAYVVGVPTPTSGAGHLTAYPSDGPEPDNASATVNYEAQQVNGNTTNVTLCQPGPTCPTDGQMAIKAFTTEQNVVIDVQGYFYPKTGTCPDDMVAVGSLCVDKHEASVTNAAGDTQYGVAGADYPCANSGRDCGAAGSNPAIYARSEAGTPSAHITWWQAAQACANVGKRLPTSAEWQAAASGTPSGAAGGCNMSGAIADTGSLTTVCVSSAGAFDMIGNLWEWVADMDNPGLLPAITTTDDFQAWSMGDSFNGDADASTRALWADDLGNTSSRRGLRCVR